MIWFREYCTEIALAVALILAAVTLGLAYGEPLIVIHDQTQTVEMTP